MPLNTFDTPRDFLRYSVSEFRKNNLFFGHGTNNAYDEAVCLLLQTLDLPIDQLEPYLDAKLLQSEKELILFRIKERIEKRIPLPYITNKAYLQGFEFYVDNRVIIPRSYIAEIIVKDQLNPWIEHPELINTALDLCTGNGSLATITANYFYDAEVVAADISEDALEVAKINLERNGLADDVKLIQSDLFRNLDSYMNFFDLIVTNPPYVDTRRMNSLTKEFKYEPDIALFGGNDGLEFVDKILRQAKHYLTRHGVLVVEMGDNRYELEELYPDLNLIWLDTEAGDGFVFVITRADLEDYFD
ncbi:MAG: 50S ribosomal protein L3 N(5)-glutamine methyltransferase [Burkholderiales bacterium]|nr:50S ribosomal protein L3 N(5)-glutamine methyltransferase [Burkholderiales bacterium]